MAGHMAPSTSSETPRRSADDYRQAALEALDRWGPAEATLGMSVPRIVESAGVNRSTVYRHWETAAAFNDEVAWFIATQLDGWFHAILEAPPDQPLLVTIGDAVLRPGAGLGTAIEAIVIGWPSSSPARRDIVACDRARRARFAAWMAQHLRSRGLVPVGDVSVELVAATILAMVSGRVLLFDMRSGMTGHDWTDEEVESLVAACERAVATMTTAAGEGESAAAGAAVWPGSIDAPGGEGGTVGHREVGATKVAILSACVDAFRASSFGDPTYPSPPRLVDLGRLARSLDISERRLQAVWPSTREMNSELLVAVVDRLREEAQDLAMEALSVGLAAPYESFDQLLISALHAAIGAGSAHLPTSYFTCGTALIDPVPRAAFLAALDEWRASLQVVLLAGLSMAGWFRHPEVSIEGYASQVFDVVAGLQLMAGLHPEVLVEEVAFRGAPCSLVGVAGYHLLCSISTRERVAPQVPGGRAPGI